MSYSPSKKKLGTLPIFGHAQYSPLVPVQCCQQAQFWKAWAIFDFVKGGKSTKCSKSFVRGCRGNCQKRALKQRWGNSADRNPKEGTDGQNLIYPPPPENVFEKTPFEVIWAVKPYFEVEHYATSCPWWWKNYSFQRLGAKVVRGFSFLAELSFLAGRLLDLIFVGKVTNFARVLNFLKGSVGR